MTVEEKKPELMIKVEGADQDAALAAAEKLAAKKGYAKVSLKNIIKITYDAMLYEPVDKVEK